MKSRVVVMPILAYWACLAILGAVLGWWAMDTLRDGVHRPWTYPLSALTLIMVFGSKVVRVVDEPEADAPDQP